jgi:hypothetical protein
MSEKLEQDKFSNAPYDETEFHEGGLEGPEPTAEDWKT